MSVVRALSGVEPATRTVSKSVSSSSASARATSGGRPSLSVSAGCNSATAEEHVARDGLVRRAGREGIRAGKIDELDRFAVLRVGLAHLLLDGDAGIVADLLFQAGERVEQRALAAVRVADQRVDGSALG